MKQLFTLLLCLSFWCSYGQLLVGHTTGRINFREGPGAGAKVHSTLDKGNTIIVLPRDTVKGYIEVFDVESAYHGYIYKSLVIVTDTMDPQKQNFFQKEGKANEKYIIEIDLTNRTSMNLFVWMNGITYRLGPYEKKVLELTDGKIKYFAAAKGIFPIYGFEELLNGYTYKWEFKL